MRNPNFNKIATVFLLLLLSSAKADYTFIFKTDIPGDFGDGSTVTLLSPAPPIGSRLPLSDITGVVIKGGGPGGTDLIDGVNATLGGGDLVEYTPDYFMAEFGIGDYLIDSLLEGNFILRPGPGGDPAFIVTDGHWLPESSVPDGFSTLLLMLAGVAALAGYAKLSSGACFFQRGETNLAAP